MNDHICLTYKEAVAIVVFMILIAYLD